MLRLDGDILGESVVVRRDDEDRRTDGRVRRRSDDSPDALVAGPAGKKRESCGRAVVEHVKVASAHGRVGHLDEQPIGGLGRHVRMHDLDATGRGVLRCFHVRKALNAGDMVY